MKQPIPFDERRFAEMLKKTLNEENLPKGWNEKVREAVRGQTPARKISIALVVCLVIVLAMGAALAAALWPEFIKNTFQQGEHPRAEMGLLSMIDQLKGTEQIGEAEAGGVRMRAHYAVVDGTEWAVLFSMQNTNPEMPPVTDILKEARLTLDTEYSPEIALSLSEWYDEENEILYCLGIGDSRGVTVSPEDEIPVNLTVFAMARMPPKVQPLCPLTPEGIASLETDQNIAPATSGAESLIIHSATLADGSVTVEYTLSQKTPNGDPCTSAYLAAITRDEKGWNISATPALDGYSVVNGTSTLCGDAPEDGVLALCTAQANQITRGRYSWSVPTLVSIREQLPVTHIPLDHTATFEDISLHLTGADMKMTGLTLYLDGVISGEILKSGYVSFTRMFGFEFLEGDELLPLSITGSTGRKDGAQISAAELTFKSAPIHTPKSLTLRLWMLNDPGTVQEFTLLP